MERKRIRLFFIINTYSMGGGAEALLTTIVNNLPDEKYEIGIMEIIHSDVKTEPTKKSVKIYPYYTKQFAPNRNERMYYVYRDWDKVIREYIPDDYDIYISFNYLKPSFLLPKDKKTIAWIHGDIYDLKDEKMHEEYEFQRAAFAKADRIVAISDTTKQSILDLYPEYTDKIRLIYNGIDVERIRSKAKENCDIVLKKPAILQVGRLEDNKNPMRTLEIFKEVIGYIPEAHLYFLGKGELDVEILKWSKANSLEDHVHLLGYHDNPFPIVKQCDVIAMFSKSEGFPMALLEGVALEKCFVSSEIGGAKTLSRNNVCGKVISNNADAVQAFLSILSLPEERRADICRETIEQFGLKKYIHNIESVIEELLDN